MDREEKRMSLEEYGELVEEILELIKKFGPDSDQLREFKVAHYQDEEICLTTELLADLTREQQADSEGPEPS